MTQEDKTKLNEFVKEYKEISFNLDLMQKSIEGLAEKRDKLLERVEELKLQEKGFMKHLIEEYGASEVTPNKLAQYVEE